MEPTVRRRMLFHVVRQEAPELAGWTVITLGLAAVLVLLGPV